MRDIESRRDIEQLVDLFYSKVVKDDILGPYFNDKNVMDWDKHIPVMYNFWESILLDNPKYQGNPMLKHLDVHKIKPIKKEHFIRWLALWEQSTDELFKGEVASEAVSRAKSIGELMQYKIDQLNTRS